MPTPKQHRNDTETTPKRHRNDTKMTQNRQNVSIFVNLVSTLCQLCVNFVSILGRCLGKADGHFGQTPLIFGQICGVWSVVCVSTPVRLRAVFVSTLSRAAVGKTPARFWESGVAVAGLSPTSPHRTGLPLFPFSSFRMASDQQLHYPPCGARCHLPRWARHLIPLGGGRLGLM